MWIFFLVYTGHGHERWSWIKFYGMILLCGGTFFYLWLDLKFQKDKDQSEGSEEIDITTNWDSEEEEELLSYRAKTNKLIGKYKRSKRKFSTEDSAQTNSYIASTMNTTIENTPQRSMKDHTVTGKSM